MTMHRWPMLLGLAFLSFAIYRGEFQSPAVGQELHSRESWEHYPKYPGGKTLYYRKGEGRDLAGELDANRKLNAEDLRLLLELSAFALDKRYAWNARAAALRDLGRLGHSHAIPALVAALRDEKDALDVRQEAAQALTRIRNPRVVDYLIEDALGSGVDVLANDTLVAMMQFIGAVPPQFFDPELPGGVIWPPEHPKELPGYIDAWKTWWATYRDLAKFDTTSPRHAH